MNQKELDAVGELASLFDLEHDQMVDIILDGFGVKHRGNIPEELTEQIETLYLNT